MIPASQLTGFGDLSFNSHSHSISHLNSAQIPFSYSKPTKFQLELHDPNGGEEEDEWAVYASSRVSTREKIGSGNLQVGPTQKPEDNVDEWGLFVAGPVGGPANHTISPDISSRKFENGVLQVGPAQNGEDWGLFISSPVESQRKVNGSNPVSSNINSIASEISTQTNNGGLQAGLIQNEDWDLFGSYTGSTTNLIPTHQTSDKKDRIDDLQANPSQVKILVEEEEEEEEWGTFVSTPVAPQALDNDSNGTRTSVFNNISQRKLGSVNLHVRPIDYEEEWGEFVSSPVASGTKSGVSNSSSASPSVKWEKPKGPIPLSFFGGEQEELVEEEIKIETLPNLRPVSVSHSDSFSDASPSNSSGVLKEIVLNHYGVIENLELKKAPSPKINGHDFNQEATTTSSLNGCKSTTSNLGSTGEKAEHSASSWDPFADGENGVGNEAWEFKDASSDITSSLTASPPKEDSTSSWAPFSQSNKQAVSSSATEHKNGTLGLYTKPNHYEKQTSSPGLLSHSKMAVHETDQRYSSESSQGSVLKFYRKLQEGSMLLISHHIKGHKEASKVITFVGQKVEEERLEEIQEAYTVLKNLNVSEVLNSENSSRDACINGLLNSTEEEYLKNFEREYQLSTKILLAVENLGAALDLLKHSLSIINALEMASMEGVSSYISTWYSLISVCSQELKNGASIWAQSFSANLSEKLISSGENYFIALGEIYRIVEIVKLTLKRFSSLLLSSNQNRLNELNMCLDICTKAWGSGLNVALETISGGNSASALSAKSLAESIKRIREVDIQNDDLYKERAYCKLCLLPLALLPEMKPITWHGDQYVMKLVNLWANKISSEPPRLPSIQMK
ncbi:hypothetical protein FCM35_KLT20393 [Carex littledalei]|uniref:Synergin gamma C-terminal domain-containing protein n=1 Tax=Carex littledalei TaxID=544730 RepID=A0A833RH76_9POAL|nr:hypothetical protein FCM35_KLT20393 [Carex littledalei]